MSRYQRIPPKAGVPFAKEMALTMTTRDASGAEVKDVCLPALPPRPRNDQSTDIINSKMTRPPPF